MTIIVVALAMVVIMAMAALVVDIGAAYNERRQDQSAVDAAALAGAQMAGAYAKAANPLQYALNEAKRLAEVDIGRPISMTQWSQCSDSGALIWKSNQAELGLTNGSPCVSFDAGFTRIRVRLPNQSVATSFARVLGANSITTSAFAEASISLDGAGQFPSSVYSGVGAGSRVCLSGGEKPIGVCPGGSGTFGSFKPMYYTAIPLGGNNTSLCDSGNSNDALSRAMADGLDHALGFWATYDLLNPPTSGYRINGSGCPQNATPALPNTVQKGTGNEQAALFKGLITGATQSHQYGPYTARFQRGSFKNSSDPNIPAWRINGLDLDNRPLWTFLEQNTGIQECTDARAYGSTLADRAVADLAVAKMTQCLTEWSKLGAGNLNKKPIFVEDVKLSPRLASVPRFAELADCGSSSCDYHIIGFSPLFMTSVFAEQSGNGINIKPSCTRFAPGPPPSTKTFCVHTSGLADSWTTANNNPSLEGLEALTIPCGALPEPICVTLDPSKEGQDFGTSFVIQLLK